MFYVLYVFNSGWMGIFGITAHIKVDHKFNLLENGFVNIIL